MLNAKSLSLGGVIAALNVVILFIASVMPTSRLFFLVVSSFAISIMVIETGSIGGLVFYLATSILSLILIPNKLISVYYICFFGFYGIIKSYIEKKRFRMYMELALKLIVFNISLFVVYIIFSRIFMMKIFVTGSPFIAIFILLQISFLVYDYVYTIFISFYYKNAKRH
ncbi:hypothetical protein [Thermoanaerobacterium butyriciformans]|uniref:Rod shape-determining protein MreD n=1 Tax=Thermoanaerobacterium butyriciformans TaxID=1702242 RepID=A0ABS4NC59_9THEO|nr:hypothetical protein [Thermoanaerobacterium butyriciformans]MBP2071249.1 hypothetical protein [Thermoanaerobacterium butyriciformans]